MKEIQNLNPVAYHEDLYDYAGTFSRVNLRPYQALGFDLRALFERFIASSEAQANHEIFTPILIYCTPTFWVKICQRENRRKYSLAKKPGSCPSITANNTETHTSLPSYQTGIY